MPIHLAQVGEEGDAASGGDAQPSALGLHVPTRQHQGLIRPAVGGRCRSDVRQGKGGRCRDPSQGITQHCQYVAAGASFKVGPGSRSVAVDYCDCQLGQAPAGVLHGLLGYGNTHLDRNSSRPNSSRNARSGCFGNASRAKKQMHMALGLRQMHGCLAAPWVQSKYEGVWVGSQLALCN